MKESSKVTERLAAKNLWSRNNNTIWLTSTLSLSRNLEKFKFPSTLPSDGRKQIVSVISRELLQSPQLKHPSLLKSEDCSPVDKEFLFEHFLTTQSFYQAHSGEAFVIDESGEFVGILNLPDHLELFLSNTEGELEDALSRLVKIDVDLGKKLSFASSPRFGFLTANPAHCGTGLVVQAFLQLPALIHRDQATQTIAKLKPEGISISGLHGSPQEHIGDILVARNTFCLGVTEDQILASVRTFATQLVAEERKLRTQIKHQNDAEIKDKVSRAFGLLAFSYQIEAVEALNAISMLKLGVDLDLVENVSVTKLNELFFNCRRAHLLAQDTHAVPAVELGHRRADFLHGALQGAHLKT